MPHYCTPRKSERKITFEQFQDALIMIAEKKYRGERDPLALLESKIMAGKGPSVSGTTVSWWLKGPGDKSQKAKSQVT